MKKLNGVVYLWLFVGLLFGCGNTKPVPPVPTISNVTVGAASTTLEAAGEIVLSSTVTGTNDFDSSVNWSIISGSGVLSGTSGSRVTFTAPSLNSSSVTRIRATSVQDTRKFGEIALNINALAIPVVPDFQLTSMSPTNPVVYANSKQFIDVQIERLHGFNEQITLSASALPSGVSVDSVILQGNETRARLEIVTAKSVSTTSYVRMIVQATSKSLTRLQEYPFQLNQFVVPVINLSVPSYTVVNGEEIKLTAKIKWDFGKHGVEWKIFQGDTEIILTELSRQDIINFDATEGSYTSSITYKVPAIFSELRAQANVKTVPEVNSTGNFLPQHKISQIRTWVINRIAVSPNCVQRDSSMSCGTDLDAYTDEAKATGQVVPLDAKSIALPAVGVPVPSQVGTANTGVTWVIEQGVGSVKQVNGNWYYTVDYPSTVPSLGNSLINVVLKATSLEEPSITTSLQFNVGFFVISPPDQFDPPFVRWPDTNISDTTAIQLAMRGSHKPAGQSFTLVWSVNAAQGSPGSITQRGCFQPPTLAAGESRDITVRVKVAEVPILEFEKVIRASHGATTQGGGCDWLSPDNNGWLNP
jgi:hypothetical protein